MSPARAIGVALLTTGVALLVLVGARFLAVAWGLNPIAVIVVSAVATLIAAVSVPAVFIRRGTLP